MAHTPNINRAPGPEVLERRNYPNLNDRTLKEEKGIERIQIIFCAKKRLEAVNISTPQHE